MTDVSAIQTCETFLIALAKDVEKTLQAGGFKPAALLNFIDVLEMLQPVLSALPAVPAEFKTLSSDDVMGLISSAIAQFPELPAGLLSVIEASVKFFVDGISLFHAFQAMNPTPVAAPVDVPPAPAAPAAQ